MKKFELVPLNTVDHSYHHVKTPLANKTNDLPISFRLHRHLFQDKSATVPTTERINRCGDCGCISVLEPNSAEIDQTYRYHVTKYIYGFILLRIVYL